MTFPTQPQTHDTVENNKIDERGQHESVAFTNYWTTKREEEEEEEEKQEKQEEQEEEVKFSYVTPALTCATW